MSMPPGSRMAAFPPMRSIYLGHLDPNVHEDMLRHICAGFGAVTAVKIIRDRLSGRPSGYGFVDFADSESAARAIATLNGQKIFEYEVRVNWAHPSSSPAAGRTPDASPSLELFVGDLSGEIDDRRLFELFATFPSLSDARVVVDPMTGRSRGFGFVTLRSREDAARAIDLMNGAFVGSRKLRVNWATSARGVTDPTAAFSMAAPTTPLDYTTVVTSAPPDNSTVYVGNLATVVSPAFTSGGYGDGSALESELRALFSTVGMVREVRRMGDKGYAFVTMASHELAALAIASLNGRDVAGRSIKLGWGRPSGAPMGYSAPVVAPSPFAYGAPPAPAPSSMMMWPPQPAAPGDAMTMLPPSPIPGFPHPYGLP